ncbi:hypothetical protein HXX76_011358 [Chlamydomonas incerta]|uniref:Uncharacterized protein n=1 Tax=Chlamydomonas incerta TaxID=51695 RepID=A0A835VWP5_CHLIN|nr:hypothetical protein HXX76_011358 [Chlamydomonas incerta]|eukprot:KAG2428653.1 hypothetical protein HXX76_011358 [Chlamydomonas incerta]
MASAQQRDPLVEGCLQLARATGFKQPAEAGTATTRMQLTRAIRPANREAVQALVDRYKAPEQAARIRALAADARAAGAYTPQQVDLHHVRRALQRRQAAMQQRAQEHEHAQAQLTAQTQAQIKAALEEQAALERAKQEQAEQRERAASLQQLLHRGRKLRPMMEGFAAHQRQQIAAVRKRMRSDADPAADAEMSEAVGQLVGQVQQELWQQLNAESMSGMAAAMATSGALQLTTGGSEDDAGTLALALRAEGSAASGLGSGCAAGAGAGPDLEPHLHLPRTSPLQRHVQALLQLPPRKLAAAVAQLSKLSYGGVTGLLRGADLLADARRRVAALGAAVDPLFDTRKLQQARTAELSAKRGSELEATLALRTLEAEVRATKAAVLELAALPAVKAALARPGVLARVKVESRSAMLAAAREALEALRRDAASSAAVKEEVLRLEAAAFDMEGEDRRLERLMSLLGRSLTAALSEWQQQYPANLEFVQSMLPKSYGEVLEAAGRSVDRLARGVEQLMRLPAELLPLLAAQRAAAGAGAGPGAAPAGGAGVLALAAHKGPGALSAAGSLNLALTLIERNRLALTYVGQPRAAAALRAAAAGGGAAAAGPAGVSTSAAGALLLRGSAASAASSGSHHADADGGGGSGFFAMGSGGMGFWEGSLHESQARSGGSSGGLAAQPPAAAGGATVAWGPGPAALGLPVLCYWQALAAALDPLAPLRCPSALLSDFLERFKQHEEAVRWLAGADGKLRPRHKQLAALPSSVAALRERLGAKRQADAGERLGKLSRSRADLVTAAQKIGPRVERAMREMETQGAVQLVPWRTVDGKSCGQFLEELRSLFSRINAAQQQPMGGGGGGFGGPPMRLGF